MTRSKRKNTRGATRIDTEIGARVRFARVNAGLSQDELGNKLGVSFQQVQKYEKGTNRITGVRLFKLCGVLKIDPNYLLGWNGDNGAGAAGSLSARMIKTAMLFDELAPPYHTEVSHLVDSLIAHQAQTAKAAKRNAARAEAKQ
jgi:transcriptional regulator with XRE-family HTH domain